MKSLGNEIAPITPSKTKAKAKANLESTTCKLIRQTLLNTSAAAIQARETDLDFKLSMSTLKVSRKIDHLQICPSAVETRSKHYIRPQP